MVYMPGVQTCLKCNLINYVSHEKKFLCGRNEKKKKANMSVIPNGVTKYTGFGLHGVVKCSNFTLKRVKVGK